MKVEYFEGRHVQPYAVFVRASELVVGETYYRVLFVNDTALIPEMYALVYVGRNLDGEDPALLFFQDARSYLAGIRYHDSSDAEARPAEFADEGDTVVGEFHTIAEHSPFVQEYERALDVLLRCSLERRGLTS